MGDKLKVILADDEYYICMLLAKVIPFASLEMELIGTACDGETLLAMIESQAPDIVVTDIMMPKLDGLEVIRRTREQGRGTNFILLSGHREFEYAYNALKYGVEDYILKPVQEQELIAALEKAAAQLRQPSEAELSDSRQALRAMFFNDKLLEELAAEPLPLEKINRTYSTRFVPGCFRMVKIRLDHRRSGTAQEAVDTAEQKLSRAIRDAVDRFCTEILSESASDGVLALLNYPRERDRAVQSELIALSERLARLPDYQQDFYVTLCVSAAVSDPCEGLHIKHQVRTAEWSRMIRGVNGSIFYKPGLVELTHVCTEAFGELEQRAKRAIESVDAPAFRAVARTFFDLSPELLCQQEALRFAEYVRDTILDNFGDRDLGSCEVSDLCRRIAEKIHRTYTMKTFSELYTAEYSALLEQLASSLDKQQARPVRLAVNYVEQHCAEPLNLSDVADEVGLNPMYFSKLFKKETGTNFTEYVTEVRLRRARELLQKSDLNISEVAFRVGFSDGQYFSKIFKKIVGVTPTAYRERRS